jgi:hypothetical protein
VISLRPGAAAAGLLAIAVVLAACGGGRPESQTPGATGSPGASGVAGPSPTNWPGQVALAIIALGAADNEIGKASADLQRSIADEDISLMREAADGLTGLTVLYERVDQIDDFELTRPLAARYREVLPKLIDSSTKLRDAIDARDANGIEQANIELARALGEYVAIRPELSTLVAEALEHQRRLLR